MIKLTVFFIFVIACPIVSPIKALDKDTDDEADIIKYDKQHLSKSTFLISHLIINFFF